MRKATSPSDQSQSLDASELAPPPASSQDQSTLKATLKPVLSGAFGGFCLVLAGHPLDLIKVRLQTSTEYKGILDVTRKTIARDGFFGLYRGMGAPLMGVVPIFSVVFWGYDVGKRIVRRFSENPSDSLTLPQTIVAGGLSAFPATTLMVPLERIKCLMQVQPDLKGPWDAFRSTIKVEGIRGMYRGTLLTLMRDVPGSMAYFGVYEVVKDLLLSVSKEGQISAAGILCAGGLAGMANWSVSIVSLTYHGAM